MPPKRLALVGTLAALDLVIFLATLYFMLRFRQGLDPGGLAWLIPALVIAPTGLLVWLTRKTAEGDASQRALAGAAPGGPAERIRRLEDLRALGLLTEDEYRRQRKKILGAA